MSIQITIHGENASEALEELLTLARGIALRSANTLGAAQAAQTTFSTAGTQAVQGAMSGLAAGVYTGDAAVGVARDSETVAGDQTATNGESKPARTRRTKAQIEAEEEGIRAAKLATDQAAAEAAARRQAAEAAAVTAQVPTAAEYVAQREDEPKVQEQDSRDEEAELRKAYPDGASMADVIAKLNAWAKLIGIDEVKKVGPSVVGFQASSDIPDVPMVRAQVCARIDAAIYEAQIATPKAAF